MTDDCEGNYQTDMVKIDVKVTRRQKETMDETWRKRGYPNRSEFIRDVLRDATEPVLTRDALQRLAEGMEDVDAGRTVGLDEAKERLGLDSSSKPT